MLEKKFSSNENLRNPISDRVGDVILTIGWE